MDAKSLSLERRCVTFDGQDVDSTFHPVNGRVKRRLNKIVDRMAAGVLRTVPHGIAIQVSVRARLHQWTLNSATGLGLKGKTV